MEAKKSLGQNFLRDEEVVAKIISAVSAREGEVIVEVGPGEGALTERLAESGARVIAIELDDRLIPILKEKFRDYPNVTIVHQNVLDADIFELLEKKREKPPTPPSRRRDTSPQAGEEEKHPSDATRYTLHATRYRVIGNLPYYITSAIVRKFLESECAPDEMFFMVQKEVGERICARPGKMSVLAVSVQYYASPELLFVVPKEAFDPVPKVESAFIRIANKTENREQKMDNRRITHNQPPDRKEFFRVVKVGFSARRKTLVNNLSNGFHLEKSVVEKLLEDTGIPVKARAQDLSVAEWKILDKSIETALKDGEGGVY